VQLAQLVVHHFLLAPAQCRAPAAKILSQAPPAVVLQVTAVDLVDLVDLGSTQ
jgi:hypothetical protein